MSEQEPPPGTGWVPDAVLESAMRENGLTPEKLARSAAVDVRTVRRLLRGETSASHQPTAEALATALGTTPKQLWPARFAPRAPHSPDSCSITTWEQRTDIPLSLWRDHFAGATQHIDVLVYGGTFLFDAVPRFLPTLHTAIDAGVQVRVAVGDPHSRSVSQRGEEEQIAHSLAERCILTLIHLAPLRETTGLHVRVHDTALYASLFRADHTMIVNHHIHGSPAGENPAFLIRRTDTPHLFDSYVTSFDTIWNSATPA